MFRGDICERVGTHHCRPRADRVVAFFAELLVHTKGRWARRAFTLDPWQEHDIVRPLFGEVEWSPEFGCYRRRYRIAYIVMARKNGKTALVAGIVLYLLIGDDEEAAEVYGAARDTKQAGKVFEVVERMRLLSPVLKERLGLNKNQRRIFDERTGSYYEIITADAMGELGANPHGVVIDEVLSQRDGSLFDAMRTAMGTRAQALMLLVTTETNDPSSFGAQAIDEAERVEEEPARAPHVFAYCRKLPRSDDELARLRERHEGHPDLPVSCDVFDPVNWRWPNPALGSFLSVKALEDEALEAHNEPAKENAWRQLRCNQRQSQVTRWLPLHLWDASAGDLSVEQLEEVLAGEACYPGLDLASTTDLACWSLLFPPAGERDWFGVLYRFWTPEAQLSALDRATGGQASSWARQGLLRTTEGDWIDYETIHRQIEADHAAFRIVKAGYDQKEATATAQHMQGLDIDLEAVYQGYGLSGALKEMMRLVKSGQYRHGGHPVARWCADSVEVRRDDQDRIKVVKPDRGASKKRIDGIAAGANSIRVWQLTTETEVVPGYYPASATA